MTKRKTRPLAKPCKAWALIDPVDRQILPHMIFDEHVRNSGPGSITEGHICIRRNGSITEGHICIRVKVNEIRTIKKRKKWKKYRVGL